jgi:O-antigen/teichoic acid export membrane protein
MFSKIMIRFRSGAGLGRDAILLSLGRYGQFAVTLITLPVIARFLSVADFGVYAIGSGLYFLGSIFTDWGLSLPVGARIRSLGRTEGRLLRETFFAFRVLTVALVLIVMVIMMVIGADVVFVLAFLAGGFSSLGEEWLLIAQGKFLAVLYCQWAGRVVYLGVVFGGLPFWQDVSVPFIGLLLGALLSALLSWRVVGRPRLGRRTGRPSTLALIRLGLPSVLAKILTNLSGASVPVILALKFPLSTIGIYNGSDRLLRAGVSALDSLVVAQFHRVSLKANAKSYSTKLFTQVCSLALVSGLVLGSAIWILAPVAETFIYGDSLPGVTDVLRVGCLLVPAAALVSTINTNVFSIKQKTGPMLVSSSVAALVLVALLLMAGSDWSAVKIAACVVTAEWCSALVTFVLGLMLVYRGRHSPEDG